MPKHIAAIVLIILIAAPLSALAEEAKPLQLAVFDPVQTVPEQESVKGLRLSLFYTANKDVTGLSIVWLGVNRATGDVHGVEIGLANWVEGSAYVGQIGVLNHAGKRFAGLQYGMVNVVEGDASGIQWGFVNWAEKSMRGVQVGLFNYTRDLKGLQIGLGNYNGNKKPLEFMVLANFSF